VALPLDTSGSSARPDPFRHAADILDDRLSPYAADPVLWVRHRLDGHLWSRQRVGIESVRDHRRTAIHSCHLAGKSYLAAACACWWLDVHPPGQARVVTSAPTADQVKGILWQEIRRMHGRGHLAGRVTQTEWWIGGDQVAIGRKPNEYNPTAFQGWHERYMLVILDEACGMPHSLWTAAHSLAGNEDSRVLAIGNPDDPGSHFATVCAVGTDWNVIGIDAFDTPNFTGELVPQELRVHLVGQVYEQEMRDEYGEDSPMYTSKVRGQFPDESDDGVVPLSWARRCQRSQHEPGELVELGLDVGAGGDRTVIRERRGAVAGRVWRDQTPDPMRVVGLTVKAINETGATRVKVDVVGIGWGVAGRLRELGPKGEHEHRAEIIPVNVGEAADNPKKFPRLRSQIWWEVGRELSRSGGWDLTGVDDKVIAQLIAPKYTIDSAGRTVVEPKEETKKRIGRSPDDADALLLAFYAGRTNKALDYAREEAARLKRRAS